MTHDSLPDFAVTLVTPDNIASFLVTSLKDYIKAHQSGLILYFYPKDNTPGCSTQAQDFSAHLASFEALGYQVIGVSRDSVKSHQKFIMDKVITFPLISDADATLCRYFDILGEKKLYGKVSIGVIRSTLVFNHAGELILAERNVRVKGHVEALLSTLSSLKHQPL